MTNTDIFLGSGASLTFIPELDLKIILDSSSSSTQLVADALWSDNVRLVENLYVGCKVDLYDNGTYVSTHTVSSNDTTSFTITPHIP